MGANLGPPQLRLLFLVWTQDLKCLPPTLRLLPPPSLVEAGQLELRCVACRFVALLRRLLLSTKSRVEFWITCDVSFLGPDHKIPIFLPLLGTFAERFREAKHRRERVEPVG